MRESFVFYKSFYEAINELPEEYRLEVLEALMEYNFNGIIPDLSPVAKAMFALMKPIIDNATQRYEASVENGKKGGAPKGNQNAKKQPKNNLKQPKNNLNVNDNVNDNVNIKEEVKEEKTTAADKVMDFYLNNINSTPVLKEVEVLASYQKELPDDLIVLAMEKAVENKARNLGYIKAILNKWIQKGITTLAEAKDERKPTITDNRLREDNVIDYEKFYANL